MSIPSLNVQVVQPQSVEPLLNACFPVPEAASFFDDFPIWQKGEGVTWLALLRPNGVPVACAGMVDGQWILESAGHPIPIARVGGVATSEGARGQGAATLLVRELLVRAGRAGAQAAVLWGQETPLYTRLGFRAVGRQLRVPLSAVVSAMDRRPGFLRLEEGGASELLLELERARLQHGGIHLSAVDLEWISKHRNTRWARVREASGKVVGFGAFGRGIDLTYQLHEWGGTMDAVRMLGRWALSIRADAEIMGKQAMLESVFGTLPGNSIVESSCLLRSLTPELEARLEGQEDEAWFWGLDGV